MWGYIVRKTGKEKERENVAPRDPTQRLRAVLVVRIVRNHLVRFQCLHGLVGG